MILDHVKEKLQRNLGKIETPLQQLSSNIGKNIVTAISNRHLAKDRMFFKKKTFEDFVADPLGIENKRRTAHNDLNVKNKVIEASLLRAKLEERKVTFGLRDDALDSFV